MNNFTVDELDALKKALNFTYENMFAKKLEDYEFTEDDKKTAEQLESLMKKFGIKHITQCF